MDDQYIASCTDSVSVKCWSKGSHLLQKLLPMLNSDNSEVIKHEIKKYILACHEKILVYFCHLEVFGY